MPVHDVQTTEYECSRCEYNYVGRKNGKERKGPPRFCPKCKTWIWNISRKNDMFRNWREEEFRRYMRNQKEGESKEAYLKRTKSDSRTVQILW